MDEIYNLYRTSVAKHMQFIQSTSYFFVSLFSLLLLFTFVLQKDSAKFCTTGDHGIIYAQCSNKNTGKQCL